MLLADYQTLSRRTATYPRSYAWAGVSPVYPVLGLAGEAGELLEKIVEGEHIAAIAKELGDVLWYATQITAEAQTTISELMRPAASFEEIPRRMHLTAVDAAVELSIRASRVSECIKKMIRDDEGVFTDERRARLTAVLSDVFLSCADVAYVTGVNLDECAQGNIDKLYSRLERDLIKGSGDDR